MKRTFKNFDEYSEYYENREHKMNDVDVVENTVTVCADGEFECKNWKTAVRRFFKEINDNSLFDGWKECITECVENGIWKEKEEYNGEHVCGGWFWEVECIDEGFWYVSLTVSKEIEEESESAETVEETIVTVNQTEVITMKEFKFCGEITEYVEIPVYVCETQKEMVKEISEIRDVLTFVDEARENLLDTAVSNEEETSVYIIYKDGSIYFKTLDEEEGKFKRYGIKAAVIETAYEYTVFGDFAVTDNGDISIEESDIEEYGVYNGQYDVKEEPEATAETVESVEETTVSETETAEQETELNAEVAEVEAEQTAEPETFSKSKSKSGSESEPTAENITVSGTNQGNINVLIVADVINTFEMITHTGYFDTS